jgi:D-alanyl-D-alanine carboxypeptidase (penicillin-binding protein 5/6)
MKRIEKLSSISLVLLAALVVASVFATAAAARSSKKQISSIDSIHKFKPGAANSQATGHGYRASVADLASLPPVKRRPDDGWPAPEEADELRKCLTSRSAIVLDVDSGEVIYAYAPDEPAQPASTIKILTGLIAIQSLGNEEWVPASLRAAGMPRSKIYLKRGKSYRADDMINAVLLSSANDASVALAEKIAGSERVFAKLMTHKARAWGAENTICKTATGLTARGQKSTVRDLAVLFTRAMENEEFAARVARTMVKTGYGQVLKNHNRALWQIDGTEGGKTGYTQAARQTYVGKFKRGEDELTVAVMGSETMWDDLKHLVEYGFAKKRSLEVAAAVD